MTGQKKEYSIIAFKACIAYMKSVIFLQIIIGCSLEETEKNICWSKEGFLPRALRMEDRGGCI